MKTSPAASIASPTGRANCGRRGSSAVAKVIVSSVAGKFVDDSVRGHHPYQRFDIIDVREVYRCSNVQFAGGIDRDRFRRADPGLSRRPAISRKNLRAVAGDYGRGSIRRDFSDMAAVGDEKIVVGIESQAEDSALNVVQSSEYGGDGAISEYSADEGGIQVPARLIRVDKIDISGPIPGDGAHAAELRVESGGAGGGRPRAPGPRDTRHDAVRIDFEDAVRIRKIDATGRHSEPLVDENRGFHG